MDQNPIQKQPQSEYANVNIIKSNRLIKKIGISIFIVVALCILFIVITYPFIKKNSEGQFSENVSTTNSLNKEVDYKTYNCDLSWEYNDKYISVAKSNVNWPTDVPIINGATNRLVRTSKYNSNEFEKSIEFIIARPTLLVLACYKKELERLGWEIGKTTTFEMNNIPGNTNGSFFNVYKNSRDVYIDIIDANLVNYGNDNLWANENTLVEIRLIKE